MKQFLTFLGAALMTLGCDGSSRSSGSFPNPTAPSVVASPPIVPVPSPPVFPNPATSSIKIGEVVRFRFTTDDARCVSWGWCRSYSITAPSDGRLEVAVTSVSLEDSLVSTIDMYVEPGPDHWDTGPGQRISVTTPVKSGATYAIRMYSVKAPSVELELRTSLQ